MGIVVRGRIVRKYRILRVWKEMYSKSWEIESERSGRRLVGRKRSSLPRPILIGLTSAESSGGSAI